MPKHTHPPKTAGYTFRKTKFTTEQAFADEVRSAINKVCDLMNTGKEHGVHVEFQINTFGENAMYVPNTNVSRKL
jgi:hypothetical protein